MESFNKICYFPSIILTLNKSSKLKSALWKIVIMPQEENAYISIINNKASRDCLISVSRGFII